MRDLDKGYLTYGSNKTTRGLLLNEVTKRQYLLYYKGHCYNPKRGARVDLPGDLGVYEPTYLNEEVRRLIVNDPDVKVVKCPVITYGSKRNVMGIKNTEAKLIGGGNIRIRIWGDRIEDFIKTMAEVKESMEANGVTETPKECKWRIVNKLS